MLQLLPLDITFTVSDSADSYKDTVSLALTSPTLYAVLQRRTRGLARARAVLRQRLQGCRDAIARRWMVARMVAGKEDARRGDADGGDASRDASLRRLLAALCRSPDPIVDLSAVVKRCVEGVGAQKLIAPADLQRLVADVSTLCSASVLQR